MDSQPTVLSINSDQASPDRLGRSPDADDQPGDPDAARAKTTSSRWSRWLVVSLVSLALAVVLLLFYWAAAYVSGLELNATTWQARRFEFLRDPFTDTQLTNVQHSLTGQFTLDAAIAVHIGGGPVRPKQPRWDLVNIHRGARFGQGDARILLHYLRATDASHDLYWVTWTTDNPQAAPVLWRAVRDAVHLERYDYLPEIFDAARIVREPAPLQSRLNQTMLALAVDEAQRKSAAGDRKGSDLAATMGLTYGESPALQSLIDAAQ